MNMYSCFNVVEHANYDDATLNHIGSYFILKSLNIYNKNAYSGVVPLKWCIG